MNSDNVILWDVETSALPAADLARMIPVFEPPGNLKDPEKIKQAVADKAASWISKAALSPISGKVLAIGYIHNGEFEFLDGGGDEGTLLEMWEKFVAHHIRKGHQFIGFCTHSFDIPFVQKRAWANNVKPMVRFDCDPYRSEHFIDLAWLWNGRSRSEFTSLNTVSRFLKVGEKSGSGADFADLWEKSRGEAIAYLRQDITLCQLIAERMGVIESSREDACAF